MHAGGARREEVQIADDGTFVCTGLPPGEVEVLLKLWPENGKARERALGKLQLVAGAPLKVVLDVPADELPASAGTGR